MEWVIASAMSQQFINYNLMFELLNTVILTLIVILPSTLQTNSEAKREEALALGAQRMKSGRRAANNRQAFHPSNSLRLTPANDLIGMKRVPPCREQLK